MSLSRKLMIAFAVALLGLGFIPSAIAGPYVSTITEFKGNEDGYSKMVNQARIGTTFKVGSLKPVSYTHLTLPTTPYV